MGERFHGGAPRRDHAAPDRDTGDEALQGALDPLSWRRAWTAYVAAHFGKSLLWTGSDLLTLYLLVSVYGIDPLVAGAMFLAGLIANAVADLAVGVWLDGHPHHAAPLAGYGLGVAALAFPATVLIAPYGLWALLAATLTFRIAYAGCDVPHNALLTRLGSDPGRAIRLARGRTAGTALASLLAAWVATRSEATAGGPLLWGLTAGAFVIGSLIVPLLAAYPPSPRGGGRDRRGGAWLPWSFLTASVIGIVALGALGKAVLHLPAGWHRPHDGAAILTLLILGRTASAIVPIRLHSVRRGLMILGASYAAAAAVAAGFAGSAGPAMLVLLGLAMGTTNLIGWALLPAIANGPRGYGLYTMASKLALGLGGLALAGGLGRVPTFSPAGFTAFALTVAAACATAALLASVRLTATPARAFSGR